MPILGQQITVDPQTIERSVQRSVAIHSFIRLIDTRLEGGSKHSRDIHPSSVLPKRLMLEHEPSHPLRIGLKLLLLACGVTLSQKNQIQSIFGLSGLVQLEHRPPLIRRFAKNTSIRRLDFLTPKRRPTVVLKSLENLDPKPRLGFRDSYRDRKRPPLALRRRGSRRILAQ